MFSNPTHNGVKVLLKSHLNLYTILTVGPENLESKLRCPQFFQTINKKKITFLIFPACFSIPIIFSNFDFNCSNLSSLRNLQEQTSEYFVRFKDLNAISKNVWPSLWRTGWQKKDVLRISSAINHCNCLTDLHVKM
jgi:hypothetical protein